MTETEKNALYQAQYGKGEYQDAYITAHQLHDQSAISEAEWQVMTDSVRVSNPELITRYEANA